MSVNSYVAVSYNILRRSAFAVPICCRRYKLFAHRRTRSSVSTKTMNGNACKKPRNEMSEFDDVWPEIVDVLTRKGLKNAEVGDAYERFKGVLEYNVPHGKKNRGLSVVTSYKLLVADSKEDDLKIARVLGWCIELLQAFFLVSDDMMDQSVTRRGRPCWYKVPGVGDVAINDSFYLESSLYELIKWFCKGKPYYIDIVELFHETTMQTILGQALDLTTSPTDGSVDLDKFSMERYSAIVKWKTAFYSFYLPVAIAMHMAGINDPEDLSNAKTILLQMGHFFQVQDDYLDCFGDPEVTGKIGTDIEDNKCGWLINKALEICTKEQRQILEENYARHDPKCVAEVKKLFNSMNLKKVYSDYEEESYQELMRLIEMYSKNLPKEIFTAFAAKIYKRQK